MKLIMEGWRNWLDEERAILLWSKATGTPVERLREGISRRDFLRGLGGMGATAMAPRALAGKDTGDTVSLWVPPDSDLRWDSSDWTGLEGFAVIDPELIENSESLARGTYTANTYLKHLEDWRTEDLMDSLTGQRATIVHGDPKSGHGLGLERFALDDGRGLKGRYKLPLSWSLMYKELLRRKMEGIDEAFDRLA